jgi:hypothetical protein
MKKDVLDRFKKEEQRKHCHLCYKVVDDYGRLSIRSTDTSNRYIGSGRPMISMYSMLLCLKCHKVVMEEFRQSVTRLGGVI